MSYAVLRPIGATYEFTGVQYTDLNKSDYDLHTSQLERLTLLEADIPASGSNAVPVYRAPTATELSNYVQVGDLPSLFSADENTKLANIESGSTGDQTGAELKALLFLQSNTNNFEDADHAKLDGIEAGAEVNLTDAEVKTAYENNADTNEFSDAEKTTLGFLTATAAVNLNDIADNATGAIPLTQKGAANGVASLDAGGKLTASQLPTSAQTLDGEWNPATNTPTLSNGSGDAGSTYFVGAGHDNVSIDLGNGAQLFSTGDQVVYTTTGLWLLVPKDTQLSDAEVVAAIGNVANSNLVTDAQVTHLAGIETGATADQSGAEIVALAAAEADTNFLSDAQQTKINGLPSNAQEKFFTPSISSPNIAPTVDQGENIAYRLTTAAANSEFMITDAAGTGISVNYQNGVMFGGAAATAGVYSIKCRAGNVFGVSDEFALSWTVEGATNNASITLSGVDAATNVSGYSIVENGGTKVRAVFARQSGYDFHIKSDLEAGAKITLSGMTATKFNVEYELIRFESGGFTTSDNVTWNSTTSPNFPQFYWNAANSFLLGWDDTNNVWRVWDLSDATGDTSDVLDMVSGTGYSWSNINLTLSSAAQSESLGSGLQESLTDEIYDIPASSIVQVTHTGTGKFPYYLYQTAGGTQLLAFNTDTGRWMAIKPTTAIDYTSTAITEDAEIAVSGASTYGDASAVGDGSDDFGDGVKIPPAASSSITYA